jgi:hypothetical protein
VPNLTSPLVAWTGICLLLAVLVLLPVVAGAWPGWAADFVIPIWFLYLAGVGILGVSWVIRRARR